MEESVEPVELPGIIQDVQTHIGITVPSVTTTSVLTEESFARAVRKYHAELTSWGMEPNEAAALALKVAAGMADAPTPVHAVLRSVEAAARVVAEAGPGAPPGARDDHAALQDAAAKVYMLFSSADSLHAAFWPQRPAAPGATTDGAASSSGGGAGAAGAAGEGAGTQQPGGEATSTSGGHSSSGSSGDQHGSAPASGATWCGWSGGGGSEELRNGRRADVSAPVALGPAAAAVMRGLDWGCVRALYDAVAALRSARVAAALAGGSEKLLLLMGTAPLGANPGLLRQVLVLLASPVAGDVEGHGVVAGLCAVMVRLHPEHREALVQLLASLPPPQLHRLVVVLQQYITITLFQAQTITQGVEDATRALGILHDANNLAGLAITAACSALAATPLTSPLLPTHPSPQPPASTTPSSEPSTKQDSSTPEPGSAAASQQQGAAAAAPALLVPQLPPPRHPPAQHLPVPYPEFYNDAVNGDDFNLKEDFRRWKSPYRSEFSFCGHPYVYDPASKARVLHMESQMAQYSELHGALFRGLFAHNPPSAADSCPFLVLKVRRGPHLVADTLVQVARAREAGALRKPLKVKFVGEEGVDEGGVQKEFFQLLVRALFDPGYGMFVYDDATRLHWFRPSKLDLTLEFELVGTLLGLALYNGHALECAFPRALYAALQGGAPGWEDLQEVHPEVAASLSKLLAMSGDEVDACCLTFAVDVDYGSDRAGGGSAVEGVELVPGGADVAVTVANRALYVELYTRHLLEGVIARQFAPFRRGFVALCGGGGGGGAGGSSSSGALSWFRPEELEVAVCGGRHLDLRALQAACLYDDGYTPDSQEVRWFWEVAHGLGEAAQKRLLAFVTGSDRVPIKGLAALNPPLVISRAGGEPDRLPTAHTCFNHLLLPPYTSRAALAARLATALDNAEGFGLM